MTHSSDEHGIAGVLEQALIDAQDAVLEFDDAVAWFRVAMPTFAEPLAVEVWCFDPTLEEVLLVRHRWRGWVPPGGAVDPGELPRDGARRELFEEAGIVADLSDRPAAVAVRSYHPEWAATLGLSYAGVVDARRPITSERGQPARWTRLADTWSSSFPEDRERMLRYLAVRRD